MEITSTYPNMDRFQILEETKPRLFPTQSEVIQKTGIGKNLIVFLIFGIFLFEMASFPFLSSITDRNALVVPVQKIDFSSPKNGIVEKVFYREGDEVKKGALILKVSSAREISEFKIAQKEAMAIKNELKAEFMELRILQLKFHEAKRLMIMGSIHYEALKEAEFIYEAKCARIKALKFRYQQTREKMRAIADQIRKGRIVAPLNGRLVSNPTIKEHAFVKEGESLFSFSSLDSVIEFHLKESDYRRITNESRAKIKFYAFPGTVYEGEVFRIHPFKVFIRSDFSPQEIQNPMKARVSIDAKPQNLLQKIYGGWL